MLIKHELDHHIVSSPTCGEIREILHNQDYNLGIAICINIYPTQGHFHVTFDETYFLLDGQITLGLYDSSNKIRTEVKLKANELCIITKGIHHKVLEASAANRLCVISFPPFHSDDEHPSNEI